MASNPVSSAVELKKSIEDMLSAHEAIAEGIATHAQKHAAAMDAKRAELKRQRAIDEGIRRNNGGL